VNPIPFNGGVGNGIDDHTLAWIFDLYRIGPSPSRKDPNTLFSGILQHIVNGFCASSGSLATVNDDGQSLTIVAGVNLPESVLGTTVPFGKRIMGQVARDREPLLLNGRLQPDPNADTGERQWHRPRSAMCWPLVVDGRLSGVLSVNRSADESLFLERDLDNGKMMVGMVVENAMLHQAQSCQISELAATNVQLAEAHAQLVQSEKLASLGQMAAGVAHEINNPIGYINSNLQSMVGYVDDLFSLLDNYATLETQLKSDNPALIALGARKKGLDEDFLREDLPNLLAECHEGVERVSRIVRDLKNFSRKDTNEWEAVDLHKGIDSTLNIVHNELKYKAEVVREYGELPSVECIPSQIGQVFTNLLVNAAHALKERGVITISTGTAGSKVWVEVADTGVGIDPAIMDKLFDPFFTTKGPGEGTGLGLSVTYGIIERHGGLIEVDSKLGQGTVFRVTLPVSQQTAPSSLLDLKATDTGIGRQV